MSLAKVSSAAVWGLDAVVVDVEVDLASGLPEFVIVGLGDKAVQESRKRVRAAIENSGYDFPAGKVTVNLAPADLKKVGPAYDLPIATAVLLAAGLKAPDEIAQAALCGELALDGTVRPVSGVLPITLGIRKHKLRTLFLPKENAAEATFVSGIEVLPVSHFTELVEHLSGQRGIEPARYTNPAQTTQFEVDLAYVVGQEQAKRGLEVAAAGGHHVLMSGPPGGGKTLLAKAMPSILPYMAEDEILEVSKIYSIAGLLTSDQPLVAERPFRSPHHSASSVSLVGGGTVPKPGEITLSHRGVLFLDEMPEFPRSVLESLRQPLEDGLISVARAAGSYRFPAQFMLLATANPCPCGYLSDPTKACRCSRGQIVSYRKKISGPLLDRIDIHLEVPKVPYEKLSEEPVAEASNAVRERVEKARQRQRDRQGKTNAELTIAELKIHCQLSKELKQLLEQSAATIGLTARGYHRVLKVARTIADLAGEPAITQDALLEAIQYRQKEDWD
ncbi:MAG: YifB family Mg chelatase-like AAA ATPase [Patescibacteria group bacterium]